MSEVSNNHLEANEIKILSIESPFEQLKSNINEDKNFFEEILNEFLSKIDGVSIAKDKPKIGKFEVTKEKKEISIIKENDYRNELDDMNPKNQTIESIQVSLADDFSYEDLPKLLLEIKNVSKNSAEIANMMTKISEKFKNEAILLNQLLLQKDLQKTDSGNPNKEKFIKNLRKTLSIQAFTYFQLSSAFDSKNPKNFDFKNTQENSKKYESFLRESEKINTPERLNQISSKINEAKKLITDKSGYFEMEFLETFALDRNNFDFLDQDDVIDYLKGDIEDNPNFNFIDKRFLFKEIEKWEKLVPKDFAINNIDDFNDQFSPLFLALDKVVSRLQIGGLRNISSGILQIAEKDFMRDVKISMESDFENVVLTNGIANVSKYSDLKDVFGGENFVQYFKERYKNEIDNIEKQKEKYKELKGKIERNPKDKNAKIELANMQMDIARAFFAIFYSQDFIKFTNGSDQQTYAVKSLLHKEKQRYGANCMLLGVIYKTLWKEFFNEDVVGVSTDGHFFAALKDANDQLVSLDLDEPKIVDINTKEEIQYSQDIILGKNFFITGEFEEIYNASLWNWIGHESFESGDYKKAEYIYKKAIERMPNHPDFWRDLGDLYRRISLVETDKERILEYRNMSKRCYMRSLALNPKNEFTNFQLGLLLSDKGFEDNIFAIKYFKKAIDANSLNISTYVNLGYVTLQLLKDVKENGNKQKLDVFIKDVIKYIEKSLSMVTKNVKIYKILEYLYAEIGDFKKQEIMLSLVSETEIMLTSNQADKKSA